MSGERQKVEIDIGCGTACVLFGIMAALLSISSALREIAKALSQ